MNSKKILEHLRSSGYYIIPKYFSRYECERLIKHIDRLMEKYPNKIQCDFKEGMGGDYRLFGLENTDQLIHKSLFENEYFNLIQTHTQNPDVSPCTALAGVVEKIGGQVTNSGGGWHRDPGSQYGDKIKTIIYLNDVGSQNGPFTIIPESRISDVGIGSFRADTEKCHKGLRVCDDFIKELGSQGKNPIELTGEAGTLILVDVGNIHMGKPIEEGKRYTLTNYFQYNSRSSESFKKRNRKHYINSSE